MQLLLMLAPRRRVDFAPRACYNQYIACHPAAIHQMSRFFTQNLIFSLHKTVEAAIMQVRKRNGSVVDFVR